MSHQQQIEILSEAALRLHEDGYQIISSKTLAEEHFGKRKAWPEVIEAVQGKISTVVKYLNQHGSTCVCVNERARKFANRLEKLTPQQAQSLLPARAHPISCIAFIGPSPGLEALLTAAKSKDISYLRTRGRNTVGDLVTARKNELIGIEAFKDSVGPLEGMLEPARRLRELPE